MTARRQAASLSAAIVFVLVTAAPALAHVDLVRSRPADGVVRDGNVRVITLEFSTEAEPAGAGVEVLLPDGSITVPDDLSSTDGVTWTATFDDPLPGGTIGVRWTMRAGDAHPRTGSFTFEVAAGTSAAPTDGQNPSADSATLDDFLTSDATGGVAALATAFGRALATLGIVLGVGALIFASTTLRGSEDDVRYAVFWVRRFAMVGIIGGLVEMFAMVVDTSGVAAVANPLAYPEVLGSFAGLAVLLRGIGSYGLLAFARHASIRSDAQADVVAAVAGRLPAPALTGGRGHVGAVSTGGSVPFRFDWSGSRLAVVGASMAVTSFVFDGHTVTKGVFPLTALAAAVHVGAAATWVGGVVMLVLIARRRRRMTGAGELLALAVRFSVVASLSVVVVGVAGVVLTLSIVDEPSVLWATPWGRLLLAKLALVAVAGGLGLHNHRTLIPTYLDDPDAPGAGQDLLRAVQIEAAVLATVILVTVFLVGSSAV